tara:strand:+ start:359 stop:466 length:108 start_codon:yes stop_codon:yes gene_type:complete
MRREARKSTENLIPDEVEDDSKPEPAAKSSLFKRR